MSFTVIIPARYEATRLPGKVLLDIEGKTMLQHVYERAKESGAEDVIIAADDERIQEAAEAFGATVCMTHSGHASGTERLAEAVSTLEFEDDDVVVNVQGDEPLIPPSLIHQVASDSVTHENIRVCTVCKPIESADELLDPSIVKVVLNHRNFALYFSRAPIPWQRNGFPPEEGDKLEGQQHCRHIGVYAYRASFLQEYVGWKPCQLEQIESLEQLRVLWNGGRIHAVLTEEDVPRGVDTEQDLEMVRKTLSKK